MPQGITEANQAQISWTTTSPASISGFSLPSVIIPESNKKAIVTVDVEYTGVGPTCTATFGGTAMVAGGSVTNAGPGNRYFTQVFYLDNAALEAEGAGSKTITITATGTVTGLHGLVGLFYNAGQGAPAFAGATETSATAISVTNATAAGSYSLVWAIADERTGGNSWTANNNLIPHFSSNPTSPSLGFVSFDAVQPGSVSTPYTLTRTDTPPAGKITAGSAVVTSITNFSVLYSATVNAVGAVNTAILDLQPFVASTVAVSTVTVANLFRNRGYVATVPASLTVTPTAVRNIKLQTLVSAASTVTVQPFDRATGLAALVEPVAVPSGKFNATRPIAAVVSATSTVTPQFGENFAETQYSTAPGDYVELYEIDTTVIGGSDVFRFIPHRFEAPDAQVIWKGETFILFPIEVEGFEQQSTGAAPPQPTMTVSNVNKFILAAVLELGDIVGAKVTRWRTYARFLDNGETPDPNAHYAPDIYYVQKKVAHTREGFRFTLSSAIDLPGIRLPRRQVLKDQSSDDRNLYAPGAANVRFRGR